MNLDLPASFEEAAPNLLPLLRPTGKYGPDLVRRPFAPGVDQLIAIDLPHVRVMLHTAHLEEWGASAEAAFIEAAGNLYPDDGLRRRADGAWELASGDGYESSRLAIPGWLAAFAGRVTGAPIAFIPHARALWVCGSEDAVLEQLREEADRAWRTEGEPISPEAFSVDALY